MQPTYTNLPNIRQPLWLDPDDHSPNAEMRRFTLMQTMSVRTNGKGFRMAPSSPKHPLIKSSKPTTRMEKLGMFLAPHIDAEDAEKVNEAIKLGKRSKR